MNCVLAAAQQLAAAGQLAAGIWQQQSSRQQQGSRWPQGRGAHVLKGLEYVWQPRGRNAGAGVHDRYEGGVLRRGRRDAHRPVGSDCCVCCACLRVLVHECDAGAGELCACTCIFSAILATEGRTSNKKTSCTAARQRTAAQSCLSWDPAANSLFKTPSHPWCVKREALPTRLKSTWGRRWRWGSDQKCFRLIKQAASNALPLALSVMRAIRK